MVPNYKKMYFRLFAALTTAKEVLEEAQKETEEMALEESLPPITLTPPCLQKEEPSV